MNRYKIYLSALALALTMAACQKDFDEIVADSSATATASTQISFTVTSPESRVEVTDRINLSWVAGDQMMFFNSSSGANASGNILNATISDVSDNLVTFAGSVTPTSGNLIGFYPASGAHNNQTSSYNIAINSGLRLAQPLYLRYTYDANSAITPSSLASYSYMYVVSNEELASGTVNQLTGTVEHLMAYLDFDLDIASGKTLEKLFIHLDTPLSYQSVQLNATTGAPTFDAVVDYMGASGEGSATYMIYDDFVVEFRDETSGDLGVAADTNGIVPLRIPLFAQTLSGTYWTLYATYSDGSESVVTIAPNATLEAGMVYYDEASHKIDMTATEATQTAKIGDFVCSDGSYYSSAAEAVAAGKTIDGIIYELHYRTSDVIPSKAYSIYSANKFYMDYTNYNGGTTSSWGIDRKVAEASGLDNLALVLDYVTGGTDEYFADFAGASVTYSEILETAFPALSFAYAMNSKSVDNLVDYTTMTSSTELSSESHTNVWYTPSTQESLSYVCSAARMQGGSAYNYFTLREEELISASSDYSEINQIFQLSNSNMKTSTLLYATTGTTNGKPYYTREKSIFTANSNDYVGAPGSSILSGTQTTRPVKQIYYADYAFVDVNVNSIAITDASGSDLPSVELYTTESSYKFNVATNPVNASAATAVWSIEGANTTDATITDWGLLTIGSTEGALTVKVVVTDTLNGQTYEDTVAVTITGYTFSGFEVSFEDTDIASQDIADGGYATQPADPTKDGYTFLGWCTDTTYATAFDFDTMPITADTKIYPYWWDNTQTIMNISTALDLYRFAQVINGGIGALTINTYKTIDAVMTEDIDLSTICSETLGSWAPIGISSVSYTGTFDGGGHKISGLYVNSSTTGMTGLFGYIRGATIKDLTIYNPSVTSSKNVAGVFTGYATSDDEIDNVLENCTVEGGFVKATYSVGGMVGSAGRLTMKNCHNKGTAVTKTGTSTCAGGLVGSIARTANLSDCSNSGYVDASSGGASNAGLVGLVGASSTSYVATFTSCYNTGDLKTSNVANNGGIVGLLYGTGTFSYCYNTGDITASSYGTGNPNYVGGIVGLQNDNTATTYYGCFNTGDISGSNYVGGIAGGFAKALSVMAGCYNTGSISGMNDTASTAIGGLAGTGNAANKIVGCYNIGAVSSLYAGGYIGGVAGTMSASGTYTSNYYLSSVAATGNITTLTTAQATGVNSASEISIDAMNSALSSASLSYSFEAGDDYPVIVGITSDTNKPGTVVDPDATISISLPSGVAATTYTVADASITLDATIENGSGDVTWKSSDSAVVSVDATSGALSFLSGGTATITATYSGVVSDGITFTVNLPQIALGADTTVDMRSAQSYTFGATTIYADGAEVSYSLTSGSDYASISGTTVTATTAVVVEVKATMSVNGVEYSDTQTITFDNSDVVPTNVAIVESKFAELKAGDIVDLTDCVTYDAPSYAPIYTITWSDTTEGGALTTIKDGVLTCNSAGRATIEVSIAGVSASYTFDIVELVEFSTAEDIDTTIVGLN